LTMAVYQLKDGRWVVQYRDRGSGKYRREYFGRGLEAEKKARARNKQFDFHYTRRKLPDPGPLFSELADAYLTAGRGWMEASTVRYLYIKLTRVILPELGHVQAGRISDHLLDKYVARRLKKVKRTTVHRELADIQAVLNWSVRRKYIPKNPVAGYKKPSRDDDIIRPVTIDECRRILEHAPEHVKRALTISWYTGLRPGRAELFRLTWDDVDFKEKTILVRSARKKGPPARQVPIHPAFMVKLKRWKKAGARRKVDQASGSPGHRGEIITYNGKPVKSIKKSFATAKQKAGITRRLTPYAFRHAFATTVLAAGGDLKATSEILGHSRQDTTTRIYQHTNLAIRRDVVLKLPWL